MKRIPKMVKLFLCLGVLAVVWWSLPGHVKTAKAQQAQGTDASRLNLSTYRLYTIANLTQSSLGQTWTVLNAPGMTTTAADLRDFNALTYTAYNSGGFQSGQDVTLLFVTGTPAGAAGTVAITNPSQIVSGIVDQLDGDLYIRGSFAGNGWGNNETSFVYLSPVFGDPVTPFAPLPAAQAITITLAGYCDPCHDGL